MDSEDRGSHSLKTIVDEILEVCHWQKGEVYQIKNIKLHIVTGIKKTDTPLMRSR